MMVILWNVIKKIISFKEAHNEFCTSKLRSIRSVVCLQMHENYLNNQIPGNDRDSVYI